MPARKNIRVLIAGTDPGVRDLISSSFLLNGFTVSEVESGDGAVAAVRQAQYSLVLLDISVSGMSAVEACWQIRAFAPHMRIVMFTASRSEDDIVRCLEAGADDCVTKPFRLRELLARSYALLRSTYHRDRPEGLLEDRDAPEGHGPAKCGWILRCTPLPYNHANLDALRIDQLREAICANLVSFPSQVPVFEHHDRPDLQRKLVQLYFVLGWTAESIAARFGLVDHRVRQVLSNWKRRAVALGYVQYIPPEPAWPAAAEHPAA